MTLAELPPALQTLYSVGAAIATMFAFGTLALSVDVNPAYVARK